MVGYKVQFATKKKHRLNLVTSEQLKSLPQGMAAFSEQVNVWQDWANKQMKAIEAEMLVDALPFGERHTADILALPEIGSGETLEDWLRNDSVNTYRLNSIVTQFLTHEIESEMVRTDKGQKVAQVFHSMAA